MKTLLLLFLLLAAPLWAQTTTPNLGLVKPVDIPGTWATDLNSNFDKLDAKFPGGQGGHVIQDEGADLPAQPKINFLGTAVSCVNNAGANRTECTFTGGGGGGAPTTADYLVRTADGGLDAERVVTDTTCLVWDWSVAGQAKVNISNDCLGPTQIDETANFAFSGQLIVSSTIATFPAAGTIGRFRIATDAASASTCASGGGSTKNVCFDNGSSWVVVGSLVEADTQQTTFDRGKAITNANSPSNAWRAGDGTRGVGIYGDATDGAVVDCIISGVFGDCDKGTKLNAGKVFNIKNGAGVSKFRVSETTGAITEATLDVEGSGNTITTVSEINLPPVGCSGTTGGLLWDTLATNAPTATCTAGSTNSNMMRGVADFPDSDGDYSIQRAIWLPDDWTGTVNASFMWRTSVTANDVVWQLQTACTADNEVDDVAWNTAQTVADTANGTANRLNTATISSVTMTGCAAGEQLRLRVLRNRTHASDSLAGVPSLANFKLKIRRAQ